MLSFVSAERVIVALLSLSLPSSPWRMTRHCSDDGWNSSEGAGARDKSLDPIVPARARAPEAEIESREIEWSKGCCCVYVYTYIRGGGGGTRWSNSFRSLSEIRARGSPGNQSHPALPNGESAFSARARIVTTALAARPFASARNLWRSVSLSGISAREFRLLLLLEREHHRRRGRIHLFTLLLVMYVYLPEHVLQRGRFFCAGGARLLCSRIGLIFRTMNENSGRERERERARLFPRDFKVKGSDAGLFPSVF